MREQDNVRMYYLHPDLRLLIRNTSISDKRMLKKGKLTLLIYKFIKTIKKLILGTKLLSRSTLSIHRH